MSQVAASAAGGSTFDPNSSSNDALRGLDINSFLQLFITEMQNQDPLNPMENSEILQQISQIKEVGSTEKLTSTLEAVLLGQNLSSATSLIGKQVVALDSHGNEVTGVVDKITVSNGVPRLHVGNHEIELTNVREILPSIDSDDDLS